MISHSYSSVNDLIDSVSSGFYYFGIVSNFSDVTDPRVGTIVYLAYSNTLYVWDGESWDPLTDESNNDADTIEPLRVFDQNCLRCGAPTELMQNTCPYCNTPYRKITFEMYKKEQEAKH